ncbi:MAG: hypothetical protein EZS28_000815 [Streblomastix strix]|uniref:Uncharacterized protein n=1 Tax=Streblomastix strix TaxID=222440 RepID=A0A5J4X8Y7_9EUKA|nr:MAG: hypothetical protein EZS28_000815 [Streblomastix strix]
MSDQKEEELINHEDKLPRIAEDSNQDVIDSKPLPAVQQVKNLIVEMQETNQTIEQLKKSNSEKAIMIIPLIRKMSSEEIVETFDTQLCTVITKHFQEFKFRKELRLLYSIKRIVKCAAEHKSLDVHQKFSQIFSDSGLRKKIGYNIVEQIPENYGEDDYIDDDWMMEDELQQYALIYCYMISISQADNNLLLHCGNILGRNINFLVYMINELCQEKQLKEDNKNQKGDDDDDDDLIFWIIDLEEILNVLIYTMKVEQNRHEIIQNSSIFDEIEPLFHIGCQKNLNCPHCIAFPDSINTQPLHLLALEVLAQFEEDLDNPQIFSISNDNIIAHIAPSIIAFALQSSFQFKYSMIIEVSTLPLVNLSSLPSQKQFSVNLNLLHNLIINNFRLAESVASYPNLLPILIAFTFYNTNKIKEQSTDDNENTLEVRNQCINIISEICQYCGNQIKNKILIEMKFAKSITLAVCLGGGSKEQSNAVIQSALYCFESIIPLMIDDEIYENQSHSLNSEIIEEIEEEGGLEEFDSLNLVRKI